MKKYVMAFILSLFLLAVPRPAAATSTATVKGTYQFVSPSIQNQYGYYNNGTWVPVKTCPTGKSCSNQTFVGASVGSLVFDGVSKVKFASFAQYPTGSGPKLSTLWSYSVSGYTASFTGTDTQGHTFSVSIYIGNLNSGGVATTLLFIGNKTIVGNIFTGNAILEGNTK
jgi:hypothetical protein